MSTRSVIGEIRNGIVKAVYVQFDGYPAGVGCDIQYWLHNHDGDVEAFLTRLFQYGQWRCVDEPYTDTKGDVSGYTDLAQIATDVFIEWMYIFNIDTQTFYVCVRMDDRIRVVGSSPFSLISTWDIESLEIYADNEYVDDDGWTRLRPCDMPELTLTGTQETPS